MTDLGLIIDLVVAIGGAFLGGALATRAGQPPVLGYLLAGLLIGPHAVGLVHEVESVSVLAEIGVAFLMFALGVEASLSELQAVRRVAIIGGLAQILLVIALGLVVGWGLGLDWVGRLYLGSLLALSSTAVAMKLLMDRGEAESLHGRLALGFLIMQDLSVVPMMVILPALAAPAGELLLGLALAVAKTAAVLATTILLGAYVLPRVFLRVAETRSREIFLLAIVSLVLGTAVATHALGLSLAFGAFLAGLLVSESPFSRQILAEVIPLRDIFATLFFVSVGMLIDPQFVVANAAMVLAVVLAVVVGKFLISLAIPLAFGYPGRAAVFSGLAIAQIGEFSFVLAQLGLSKGVISGQLYSLTLAVALITILLSPTALQLAPWTVRFFAGLPLVGHLFRDRAVPHGTAEPEKLTQHVVIGGFGRVGRELASAVAGRGFKYAVIDYNPHIVEEVRKLGVPAVYGNVGSEAVLAHLNLPRARVLAITVPDPTAVEAAIRHARRLAPRLDIVVRARSVQQLRRLRDTGASEVVQPEFEAGLEFVRHTLRRYGVSSTEIQGFAGARRDSFYGQD